MRRARISSSTVAGQLCEVKPRHGNVTIQRVRHSDQKENGKETTDNGDKGNEIGRVAHILLVSMLKTAR
jgi:hypothetical protein